MQTSGLSGTARSLSADRRGVFKKTLKGFIGIDKLFFVDWSSVEGALLDVRFSVPVNLFRVGVVNTYGVGDGTFYTPSDASPEGLSVLPVGRRAQVRCINVDLFVHGFVNAVSDVLFAEGLVLVIVVACKG